MDPFSILGLSSDATHDQIRSAYRKLVKLHHPDRNPFADQEQIRAINWAYETLTDPARRARYYQTFATVAEEVYQEEDPHEVYKREFKWKRWQREKRQREERIAHQKDVMRVMRMINIPIILIAALLTLDRMLPTVQYQEQMLESWRATRVGHAPGFYYFIRTANFRMHFANNMYLYLDSFSTDSVTVNIEVSPLLKIPRRASYIWNNTARSGEVARTVHTRPFFATCILLFGLINLVYRNHSPTAYAICFLPVAFLILLIWINAFD